MTELEERLLAEVTKLEDGMSSLSEQLQAINKRLDDTTTLMQAVQSDLLNFSEKQKKYSEDQQNYRRRCTSCKRTLRSS